MTEETAGRDRTRNMMIAAIIGILLVVASDIGEIKRELRGIREELHSARVAPQVATLEQTCEVEDE